MGPEFRKGPYKPLVQVSIAQICVREKGASLLYGAKASGTEDFKPED